MPSADVESSLAALEAALAALTAVSSEIDELLGTADVAGFAETAPVLRLETPATGTFGVIWNTVYQEWDDLPQLAASATSFVDSLKAMGVSVGFALGDSAVPLDFLPDAGVARIDSVKALYFLGHGSPKDLLLSPSDIGVPLQTLKFCSHLRWLIIDACDTLMWPQSDPMSLLNQWGASLTTLHGVLGLSHVGFPNEERGWYLALYLAEGLPLVQAWRRACEETQAQTSHRWAFLLVERIDGSSYGQTSAELDTAPEALSARTSLYYRTGSA